MNNKEKLMNELFNNNKFNDDLIDFDKFDKEEKKENE